MLVIKCECTGTNILACAGLFQRHQCTSAFHDLKLKDLSTDTCDDGVALCKAMLDTANHKCLRYCCITYFCTPGHLFSWDPIRQSLTHSGQKLSAFSHEAGHRLTLPFPCRSLDCKRVQNRPCAATARTSALLHFLVSPCTSWLVVWRVSRRRLFWHIRC